VVRGDRRAERPGELACGSGGTRRNASSRIRSFRCGVRIAEALSPFGAGRLRGGLLGADVRGLPWRLAPIGSERTGTAALNHGPSWGCSGNYPTGDPRETGQNGPIRFPSLGIPFAFHAEGEPYRTSAPGRSAFQTHSGPINRLLSGPGARRRPLREVGTGRSKDRLSIRSVRATGRAGSLKAYPLVLRLRSIDPDQNRWRAYAIDLQPTLFGDLALVTRWGRIGTRGQEKIYHFPNREEALSRLRTLVRRRRRHGYELVSGGRSLQLVEPPKGEARSRSGSC
jgi:predicted DNA-binding WGR domain protein